MFTPDVRAAPRLRLGVILWLTALQLAALDVRPLNTPPPSPEPHPAAWQGAGVTP